MQGYPLKVDGKEFDELRFTGMSVYAGARYSLTSKAGLWGLAGISEFGKFPECILISRLGMDYRVEW